ncbi:hypothetical protein D3C81_838730 [compost metagenome]
MQRGDVRVTEQHLGVGADAVVVQQRQQPRGTRATAHADDGLDLLVGEHGIQITGALGIGAGQMAVAGAIVLAGLHDQAQGFHRFARQLQTQALTAGR